MNHDIVKRASCAQTYTYLSNNWHISIMNQSIFVWQTKMEILFNWSVGYMVRKYLLCIKVFGCYKLIEMHLKNTMLIHSNVVSRVKYHNKQIIHKMFLLHTWLIYNMDTNSFVTLLVDISSYTLLLLWPSNFYTLPLLLLLTLSLSFPLHFFDP